MIRAAGTPAAQNPAADRPQIDKETYLLPADTAVRLIKRGKRLLYRRVPSKQQGPIDGPTAARYSPRLQPYSRLHIRSTVTAGRYARDGAAPARVGRRHRPAHRIDENSGTQSAYWVHSFTPVRSVSRPSISA